MARDPEGTKRRLLAAATAEFAEYGLSGARVDRIAEVAGANKRMIYAYFGTKEDLHATVISESHRQLVEEVPMRPDDLPGYAGELFDYLIKHPERHRLALWRQLEGPGLTPFERKSQEDKVELLAEKRGDDETLSAGALLAFIIALIQAGPGISASSGKAAKVRAEERASVVEAVRRLATNIG